MELLFIIALVITPFIFIAVSYIYERGHDTTKTQTGEQTEHEENPAFSRAAAEYFRYMDQLCKNDRGSNEALKRNKSFSIFAGLVATFSIAYFLSGFFDSNLDMPDGLETVVGMVLYFVCLLTGGFVVGPFFHERYKRPSCKKRF